MPSKDVAVVVREDSLSAAILVRRADGGFVFKRIDARVACRAFARRSVLRLPLALMGQP